MPLIDLILNIAGLLLWLSWRSIRSDPAARVAPTTLAGTFSRTSPLRLRPWHFLAVLGGLLLVRAVFYRLIGSGVNWTPKLDLVLVVLSFRGDQLTTVLLFSALSFLQTMIVFHFWLLILAVVNRRDGEPNPGLKMIQLHLGRVAAWPRLVQLILPVLVIALLWLALHPLLAYFGVVNRARSLIVLAEQGLLIGACVYLTLKYLLPVFLFAHLIGSYVYLGSSPLWDFVGATARQLLAPLNRLPLRIGKLDLAPLVGIVLILLLLHVLPNVVQNELNARNLTLWPQ